MPGNNSSDDTSIVIPLREYLDHRFNEQKQRVDELDTKMDKVLQEALPEIQTSITELKIKAGIWGAFAGAIPVIIGFGVWILTQ